MKIAIMTQPLGKNYGGVMQAYALQQVLLEMGHQATTVDRQFPKKGRLFTVLRWAYRVLMIRFGRRVAPAGIERYLGIFFKNTNAFIASNLSVTPPLYSSGDLQRHFKFAAYDAVVVGSDQTWRPSYSPNIYNYYLDFLEGKPLAKIAYASSFGVDTWEYSPNESSRCARLAKSFDAVSVREESGIFLCEQFLGVKAQFVLDPTLLLEHTNYRKLFNEGGQERCPGGIFTYWLDADTFKQAVTTQAELGLGKAAFSCQARATLNHAVSAQLQDYVMPPVEEWLQSFANADFVLTDSFHGMVFSIIFEKNFFAVVNEGRGAARFTSLLTSLGLSNRLLTTDTDLSAINFSVGIDYAGVRSRLSVLREQSRHFLGQGLACAASAERGQR